MHALWLKIAFVGAWLTPLLLVWQYHRFRMEARLKEIQRALLKEPTGARPLPAEHYVQLFDTELEPPAEDTAREQRKQQLAEVLKWQFTTYHRKWEFYPALLLFAATSAGGLLLVYAWIQRAPPGGLPYQYGIETVLAIAGAYVWSIYEILLRRASRDLTPDELYAIAVRFLVAIPIGRAMSIFANDSAKASLAFAATAFPLKDFSRFMRRRALKKIGEETPVERVDRNCLLSECVDGIDLAAVTRLEELHITTHTNLAYADPIRLMARTGYSLRMIIQWMDHALLAVYALPYKKKLNEAGLPCSLDVKEFYETHFARVADEKGNPIPWTNRDIGKCETVAALEKKLGLKRELIREIFQRVAADPHVRFLATLWYTGYRASDEPSLPNCGEHVPPAPGDAPPRRPRGARRELTAPTMEPGESGGLPKIKITGPET